ncbi:MAG: RHS repeat-associated core domain-containing protein [Candidatus Acidiferrales bacterium]
MVLTKFREFDFESSLYYYRARYYDPAAGRFVGEDPIQFDGGFNYYTYADNQPTVFVDPFGLQNENPPAKPPVAPVPHPGTNGFVASTASAFNGSTFWKSWWFGGMHGEVRPFSNKCNIFVGDVLAMNGIGLPKLHAKGEYPLAEDWGNPQIAQIGPYAIVDGQPQLGDILSDGTHVGIVVGDQLTASTNAYKGGVVTIGKWGFRPGQHPVVRRSTACGK